MRENAETGYCRKCQSEIPIAADKCSECGFEPSVGLLGKIFVWVSFMFGTTFSTIAFASLIIIADGFPIRDGLISFSIFGFLALVFFGYIINKWEVYKQKPAIQPGEDTSDIDLDEATDEIRESWKEGIERGGNIREVIDSLPGVLWTAGVVIGILLGVGVWIFTVQNLDSAMSISLIGSLVFLTFSLMIDIGHQNRTTELNFRWWAYVIPAMIPAIGFLAGVMWLARKRQKTGSVL